MAETWYRGEALGVAPARPGSTKKHDLGDGLYLTDRLDVAYRYAGERSSSDENLPVVRYGQLDPSSLGRVLDVTQGTLSEQWRNFENQNVPSSGQTNRDLMTMGGGNYGNMFAGFLMLNKIDIDQYDVVIGPEYLRGGRQMCIRRQAIADRVDASLMVGRPPGMAFQGGGSAPLAPPPGNISDWGASEYQARQGRADAVVIVGIVAVGALCNWISEYITEKRIRQDVTEWEQYIRERQPIDPRLGVLVVLTLSQPVVLPDSVYTPSPTSPDDFLRAHTRRGDVHALHDVGCSAPGEYCLHLPNCLDSSPLPRASGEARGRAHRRLV